MDSTGRLLGVTKDFDREYGPFIDVTRAENDRGLNVIRDG